MNQSSRSLLSTSALLLLLGLSWGAQAASKPEHPPKPPKEAYTACANLIENDACTITTPNGNAIDGICAPTPDSKTGGALACRPNDMPKPPQGEQPADAPEDEESAE